MNAQLPLTIVMIMLVAKIIMALSLASVTLAILEMDRFQKMYAQILMSVQILHFPTIAIIMLLARILLEVFLARVILATLEQASIVMVSIRY